MNVTSGRFLDTNVLVYLFDHDEPWKAQRTREVLAAGGNVVSVQVLQEFYASVTRKLRPPLGPAEALGALRAFTRTCRVIAADAQMVLAAAERSHRQQLSFWDALIVEAAHTSGCRYLLSEDLQHGRVLDGRLTVQNPYVGVQGGTGRMSEGDAPGPRRGRRAVRTRAQRTRRRS